MPVQRGRVRTMLEHMNDMLMLILLSGRHVERGFIIYPRRRLSLPSSRKGVLCSFTVVRYDSRPCILWVILRARAARAKWLVADG